MLREASAQLVLEVRKTVDFYRATAPVERLSRIVLSGGAWQAVGLVDLLASEFGAPVDVFDPFRRVTRSAGRLARKLRARLTRLPSVSRCGRKATDDSRQPAFARVRRAAPAREWFPPRTAFRGAGPDAPLVTGGGRRRLVVVPPSRALRDSTRVSHQPKPRLARLKDAAKLVDLVAARKSELTERLVA